MNDQELSPIMKAAIEALSVEAKKAKEDGRLDFEREVAVMVRRDRESRRLSE